MSNNKGLENINWPIVVLLEYGNTTIISAHHHPLPLSQTTVPDVHAGDVHIFEGVIGKV